MCSTFGYQWASGSISGKVTRRGAGVGDAAVNLEAITNNHSPDDNTKTSTSRATKGNYGFASVQDGEYWVRTPATATNKADSTRIAIYHDEATDDDDEDGIIGTGVTATADFALTALRLDIKGYVANDGNEGNDRRRRGRWNRARRRGSSRRRSGTGDDHQGCLQKQEGHHIQLVADRR